MGDFLRDHGLTLALVLAAVGMVSGWVSSARHEAAAELHRAQAEEARAVVDSIQQVRLQERRADSIRTAALRDSADARVARAEEARRREAVERERRERARAQALRSAADLRETLDSVQVPLFRAYEADRDAVEATLEAELGSVRTRLDEAETENESLWGVVDAKDALYGIATDEIRVKDAQIASLEAANESLRRANASGGIFPDFGDLTKPVYVAAGALLGWGGAKLTQSEGR